MTYYEDFFEFWKTNYSHESEHIKCIALKAWDAAVNGFTIDAFTDSEICDEAIVRGFEVKRIDVNDGKHMDEFGNAVGRNKYDLMGMASTVQDTFVPLGFARDQASEMSVGLTQLAVDVGSFNNSLNEFGKKVIAKVEVMYNVISDYRHIIHRWKR